MLYCLACHCSKGNNSHTDISIFWRLEIDRNLLKTVLEYYLKAPREGQPDPRGSLADEIPSSAIEQANPEIRQLTTKESKGKQGSYSTASFESLVTILLMH